MNMLKNINLKMLLKKGIAVVTAMVILVSALVIGLGSFADSIEIWDGTKAGSFAGGTGTKDDPFIIENGQQLYKMLMEYSNKTASVGKYFKITNARYQVEVNGVKMGLISSSEHTRIIKYALNVAEGKEYNAR